MAKRIGNHTLLWEKPPRILSYAAVGGKEEGEGPLGLEIAPLQRDCGLLLYHMEEQDVHAGGSGCGCSAGVLCSRILRQLEQGELRRILFVATGSLHSPTSVQQGIPISGIAHALWLEHQR